MLKSAHLTRKGARMLAVIGMLTLAFAPPASASTTLTSISSTYKLIIKNASNSLILNVANSSQTAGASIDVESSTATDAQRWHVMPMGSKTYNIENMLTHQVMGVTNASTSAGASVVQWADNGTDDHLWSFYLLDDGYYLIKNINSGLYLTSTSAGALTQEARNSSSKLQEWTVAVTSNKSYANPRSVSGTGIYVHDPDMILVNGTYYLYGTHNTLAKSTDLSTFTSVDNGIFSSDFSWWANENTTGTSGRTDLWAPSLMVSNGTYYQYYSIPIYETPSDSSTNEGAEAIIALATSTSPTGSWTDTGTIIESCGTTSGCSTEYNAIDPAVFEDTSSRWWMVFGSWEDGTHIIRLNPSTGLRWSSNSSLYDAGYRPLAGEEGPFIYPLEVDGTQYYYYFASINVCCSGTSSTYRIIMGRGTSPTGPFYDRGGLDVEDGGGTILLSTHGSIYGPGGQSVRKFGSQYWLIYHYYDGDNSGTATLGLNKMTFEDGWPHI